ncbi:MAG TPA: pyrimidine 5'-nucleotidase [Candidatus Methanoperedens sp.]|nr:pyrimidine 5'-nucleotidase [Candidatus Methanoperedens sp.]
MIDNDRCAGELREWITFRFQRTSLFTGCRAIPRDTSGQIQVSALSGEVQADPQPDLPDRGGCRAGGQRLVAAGRLWYQGPVPDEREWLFDLDNTLYPPETGLFGAVDARINEFLALHLGLDAVAADALRRRYHDQYGITLAGLMEEHGTEPHHYLDFVHGVPVGDYLLPDPGLRSLIAALPGRRSIFTNGSRRHALAVLAALGLEGIFAEIFDIVALGFRPKPEPGTYRAVLERLGCEPARAVLLDDLERNLAPARSLGMRTVLVGAAGPSAGADFTIGSLRELPAILPRLLA